MIEVVGVLVAAADREHASAEHIDKAVHDPRRVAPPREHPGQIAGQAETPLGHRQKHHAPVRGQATPIEGSCDFLGLNGWKREWQNRIIGHAGVAFAVQGDGVGFATESYAASALYTTLASLSCALSRIRRANDPAPAFRPRHAYAKGSRAKGPHITVNIHKHAPIIAGGMAPAGMVPPPLANGAGAPGRPRPGSTGAP